MATTSGVVPPASPDLNVPDVLLLAQEVSLVAPFEPQHSLSMKGTPETPEAR